MDTAVTVAATLIGNGLLVWAAVVGVASVVVHARVNWWSSPMGRHLMAYMSVVAAVLTLGVVRLLLGDAWWFSLLRVVVFTGVPIVMTQRLVLQLRVQRAARSEVVTHNVDEDARRGDA